VIESCKIQTKNILVIIYKDKGMSGYIFWREHMGDTPAVGDSH
jgi:hypothetical protein